LQDAKKVFQVGVGWAEPPSFLSLLVAFSSIWIYANRAWMHRYFSINCLLDFSSYLIAVIYSYGQDKNICICIELPSCGQVLQGLCNRLSIYSECIFTHG